MQTTRNRKCNALLIWL